MLFRRRVHARRKKSNHSSLGLRFVWYKLFLCCLVDLVIIFYFLIFGPGDIFILIVRMFRYIMIVDATGFFLFMYLGDMVGCDLVFLIDGGVGSSSQTSNKSR